MTARAPGPPGAARASYRKDVEQQWRLRAKQSTNSVPEPGGTGTDVCGDTERDHLKRLQSLFLITSFILERTE